MFVLNSSKFDIDFKNAEKNPQKYFSFLGICTWIGCYNFWLLWREYLSCVNKESCDFRYH